MAADTAIGAIASGTAVLHGNDLFVENVTLEKAWVKIVRPAGKIEGMYIVQETSELPVYRVCPVTERVKEQLLTQSVVDLVLCRRIQEAEMDPEVGWLVGEMKGGICGIFGIVQICSINVYNAANSAGTLTNGRTVRELQNMVIDGARARRATLFVHSLRLERRLDTTLAISRSDRRLCGTRWVYGTIPSNIADAIRGGYRESASVTKKPRQRARPMPAQLARPLQNLSTEDLAVALQDPKKCVEATGAIKKFYKTLPASQRRANGKAGGVDLATKIKWVTRYKALLAAGNRHCEAWPYVHAHVYVCRHACACVCAYVSPPDLCEARVMLARPQALPV